MQHLKTWTKASRNGLGPATVRLPWCWVKFYRHILNGDTVRMNIKSQMIG